MSVEQGRVEEMLTSAATLITEHGWCQHSLSDEEGRICLTGALLEVMRSERWKRLGALATWELAGRAVLREVAPRQEAPGPIQNGPSWCDVLIAWNDAPGRTEAEVLAALGNAKRHLEAEP